MSKFYGTARDPWCGRGTATRCGHKGIRTTAQSYDGSVIVDMSYDRNDELVVEVEVSQGSSTSGTQVFRGRLDELANILLANRDRR